ncbi:hypothetical protein QYE76_037346 [Lolium multiflorum]|uniref:HMG box domain-containing protein n=1 Tax=Lolium multiflorum TaxID=4521 RepID=A0AAD8Q2F0_LOLMU|nr:hypothetical protein QYE76_037346 [Lolium multiflorum]
MKGAKSNRVNLALLLPLYRDEFRKEFKEKYPKNKSVAAVGKAAGERWKSLSELLKQLWWIRRAEEEHGQLPAEEHNEVLSSGKLRRIMMSCRGLGHENGEDAELVTSDGGAAIDLGAQRGVLAIYLSFGRG